MNGGPLGFQDSSLSGFSCPFEFCSTRSGFQYVLRLSESTVKCPYLATSAKTPKNSCIHIPPSPAELFSMIVIASVSVLSCKPSGLDLAVTISITSTEDFRANTEAARDLPSSMLILDPCMGGGSDFRRGRLEIVVRDSDGEVTRRRLFGESA